MFKKKPEKNKAIAMISLVNNISEKDVLNMLFKIRALPSNNHEIKGIILRISSSGGSLGAAESLVEGLRFVKQELHHPSALQKFYSSFSPFLPTVHGRQIL